MKTPLVSVVIAAYNSSSRLLCAVESIRRQTFANLEIVVVGDAVTDDSEDRLRMLGDERISWENLDRNWGEQSVPSNRGLQLAQGDIVFFLNQDDLYRADHVHECLDLMEAEHADVVWSPYLVVPPGRRPETSDAVVISSLTGISPRHPQFDARTFIPASCTAWRRDALERLGGWRTAGECAVSPSQDLLWRSERAGMRIRGTSSPSVLVLWSGTRKGSYTASYTADDNRAWLRAVIDQPSLIDDEVGRAAVRAMALTSRPVTFRRAARRLVGQGIRWGSDVVGVHPDSLPFKIRYWRSGGFVNAIRAKNDLGRKDFSAGTPGKVS